MAALGVVVWTVGIVEIVLMWSIVCMMVLIIVMNII